MIFVTYGELEIQSRVLSPSDKKHCTVFIQRRLDYIFISNSLQEFVNDTSILTSLSTDHSPIHLSLSLKHLASSFLSSDICPVKVGTSKV